MLLSSSDGTLDYPRVREQAMASLLETMVMGLLAEKGRHGYDLLREMEERGFLRWTRASKVAIYKVLARLERKGCLTSWMERDGNMPERKIYALTAEGEEMLRDGVYALCSEEEPLRLEYAAAVAFLGLLSLEEAEEALERRRAFLEKRARQLASEQDLLSGLASELELLILEHELSLYRREVRWISRILDNIRKGGKERSPGVEGG